MVNGKMYGFGAEPSAIRALFAYGMARKAQIGADKVFDFSIGNPSVPAPDAVRRAMIELLDEPPCDLHGYTPAAGAPQVRRAVAKSIRSRFGVEASPDQVYLTAGAAAGLSIALSAVTEPGDEVIVVTPFFPEYKVWIESAGCACVEVPAQVPSFHLDVEALEAAIGPKTSALIVNSPNNPVGVVYPRRNLEALAALLANKERELGRKLYLISDEPYREISYGAEVAYLPCLYPRTLVCYSYSKSLSLPGERIGYLYVSDRMDEASEVSTAVAGAARALGFVCAPALFQRVVQRCIAEVPDVSAYAANRALLTAGLGALGYEFVEPEGAFYLWVRALQDDAQAFSERAKRYELLLVPSDSFGVTGWVRVSYCVERTTIEDAMPAFRALKESYEEAAG